MNKKALVVIIIIVIIAIPGVFFIFKFLEETPWSEDFFDPGERYIWDKLDYMDIIYENESDIYALNGAWASTNSCPWARLHEGFDFSLLNHSKVLAAAPGQVSIIREKDWGDTTENRYMVEITIRFNNTVFVNYNFEPWTNNSYYHELQKSLININVGDWVEIGQEIASFLQIGEGAHIHFDVIENDVRTRLDRYYSPEAYEKMMDLVHMWHPEWPYLCYDENTPLDYMMASFEFNWSISKVEKGYSNTPLCPWNETHLGFDFFFIDNAKVLAAAPGQVTVIECIDRGSGRQDRYALRLVLNFSQTLATEYLFEIWSDDYADYEQQLNQLQVEVKVGNWIPLAWDLGSFHKVNSSAHVHFAVNENGSPAPICQYYSTDAYNKMMGLVKYHGLDWIKLCYLIYPIP